MKKSGFTLVELTISIALLSVVMVFLLNFLVLVKKEDTGISEVTDMELDKSIISKSINSDILNNDYISSYNCTSSLCNITLNSGEKRTLEVNENIIKYTNASNNKVLLSRKTSLNYSIKSEELTTIDKIILTSEKSEYDILIISSKI